MEKTIVTTADSQVWGKNNGVLTLYFCKWPN